MKFLFNLLIVTILVLTLSLVYEFSNMKTYLGWYKSTPIEKLQILVNHDFALSAKKAELPKEWSSVKSFKTVFHSPLTEYFFKKIQVPLITTPKGQFTALMDMVDIPDAEKPGFLIQISLINIKSGDKVEEFTKDYYLTELETLPEFAKLSLEIPHSLMTTD